MAGFRAATPEMLMVSGPVVYTPVAEMSGVCLDSLQQVAVA